MDTRPPNLWFICSYVLLVVIVAVGFFWQAQTIETMEDQQQQIDHIVEFERVRTYNSAIISCQLLLDVVEPEERETVIAAFATQRVDCEAELQPLPRPPEG